MHKCLLGISHPQRKFVHAAHTDPLACRGYVRMGRILEDLDSMAGTVGFYHMCVHGDVPSTLTLNPKPSSLQAVFKLACTGHAPHSA